MKKLYRNATLIDAKAPQDLLVEEGKFTAIAPHIEADAAETIDLGGRLVVPPYVDPHLHLDYVYTARVRLCARRCARACSTSARMPM